MASQQLVVLIVSSDPREQRVLAVSLRKAGLDVHAVNDGLAALHALEAAPRAYGVAIIELNIEGMDGFELCERIRDDGRFDAMALIAVTGSRDLATKLRAFEIGFDELLPKPVYVKELGTRVELILQRRAREQLAEVAAEELEGSLAEVPVMDLVQTIEGHGRTALVRLEHDERLGELFFVDGELIDAETGGLRGEAAVYRMMRWADGFYAIKYLTALRRRRRIKRSTPAIIADGLERSERFAELEARMPMRGRYFAVDYRALGDQLDSMPATVRSLLGLFDGTRDLEAVLLHAPVADLEVLRLAEHLMNHGQLIEVQPHDVPLDVEDDEIERSHEVGAWLGDLPSYDHEPTPPWARPLHEPAVTPAPSASGLEAERRRLDADQRRLSDEQSVVLAAIARNEAEAARAQEDRARRDIEARHRRTSGPAEAPLRARSQAVVSALAGVRPLAALGPSIHEAAAALDTVAHVAQPAPAPAAAPARPTVQSIRDQVVSALADAEIAYCDSRPSSPVAAPIEPPRATLTSSALAAELGASWEARVQRHAARYEVVSTHHVLRPMTVVVDPPEPEPTSGFESRLAALGVRPMEVAPRPVEPLVAPVAAAEPLRAGIRGPSQLGAPALRAARPLEATLPDLDPDLDEELSRGAAAPSEPQRQVATPIVRDEAAALRQTVPGIRSAIVAAAAANEAARVAPTPAEPSRALSAAEIVLAPEPVATSTPAAAADKPATASDKPATSSDKPAAEVAASEPPMTPAAAVEPAVAAVPLSDFGDDDDFFQTEPAAASGTSNRFLTRAVAVLLVVLLVGTVVYLIKTSGGSTQDAVGASQGTEVTATGPETVEPSGGGDDPFETDAPPLDTESGTAAAVVDDPTLSPGYIDAVAQAESIASAVLARGELAAAALAEAPAAPVEKKPEPVVERKPEPVVEKKPEPEKKPEAAPEKKPEPKPEESKPKTEKARGGAFAEAKAAYDKKKYADAVKLFEAVVAQEPSNDEAHYLLGISAARTRQYALAVTHLEKVRGSRSGSAAYWRELGNAYAALKKDAQAVEAYSKAVELMPAGSDEVLKIQHYIDSKR